MTRSKTKARDFFSSPITELDNYYDILGIEKEATERDAIVAYRKLVLKYHPDKNPDKKEAATVIFRAIQEVYEILVDKERRKLYDKKFKLGFSANPKSTLDLDIKKQFDTLCRSIIKIINPLKKNIPIVDNLCQEVEIGSSRRMVVATDNLNDWERQHFINIVRIIDLAISTKLANSSAIGRGGKKISDTYGFSLKHSGLYGLKSYTRLAYDIESVNSLIDLVRGQEDDVLDLLQQYQEAINFTIFFNRPENSLLTAEIDFDSKKKQVRILFVSDSRKLYPTMKDTDTEHQKALAREQFQNNFRSLRSEIDVISREYQKSDEFNNIVDCCKPDETFSSLKCDLKATTRVYGQEKIDDAIKDHNQEFQLRYRILAINEYILLGYTEEIKQSIAKLTESGIELSQLGEMIKNIDVPSPLLYAIEANSTLNIVKLLVENGFNPASEDENASMLCLACEHSTSDVVKYFYKKLKNPDLNKIKKGRNGETPLHVTIREIQPALNPVQKQLEKLLIVVFLINNGASLDVADNNREQPLKPLDHCFDGNIKSIIENIQRGQQHKEKAKEKAKEKVKKQAPRGEEAITNLRKELYENKYQKTLQPSKAPHDPTIDHSKIIIEAECILTSHPSNKKLAELMDSFRLHANTILKMADRGKDVIQLANGYKQLIGKIVSKHNNPETLHKNIGRLQKNKVKRVINDAIFEKKIKNTLDGGNPAKIYESLLDEVRQYIGSSEGRLKEFGGYINKIADNLDEKTAIKPVRWPRLNFWLNPFGRTKRHIQQEINTIIREAHVAKKFFSLASYGQETQAKNTSNFLQDFYNSRSDKEHKGDPYVRLNKHSAPVGGDKSPNSSTYLHEISLLDFNAPNHERTRT